jgi:hypothetical protein
VLQRDLATEIAAELERNPATTAREIAGAIKARLADVIGTLNTEPRFVRTAPPTERSWRAKCWRVNSRSIAASAARGTVGNGASEDVTEQCLPPIRARQRGGLVARRWQLLEDIGVGVVRFRDDEESSA